MKYVSFLLLLLFCSCKFPQDPKHSFQEAQKGALEVGVVVNPPFTINKNGNWTGSEITMIESFARNKGLELEYSTATETQLMHQLENYELHIVLGGFDQKTLWKKKTGLTAAYDKKHVLLIGKGENRLLFELEKFIFKNHKR